jgi:hypothetical protein
VLFIKKYDENNSISNYIEVDCGMSYDSIPERTLVSMTLGNKEFVLGGGGNEENNNFTVAFIRKAFNVYLIEMERILPSNCSWNLYTKEEKLIRFNSINFEEDILYFREQFNDLNSIKVKLFIGDLEEIIEKYLNFNDTDILTVLLVNEIIYSLQSNKFIMFDYTELFLEDGEYILERRKLLKKKTIIYDDNSDSDSDSDINNNSKIKTKRNKIEVSSNSSSDFISSSLSSSDDIQFPKNEIEFDLFEEKFYPIEQKVIEENEKINEKEYEKYMNNRITSPKSEEDSLKIKTKRKSSATSFIKRNKRKIIFDDEEDSESDSYLKSTKHPVDIVKDTNEIFNSKVIENANYGGKPELFFPNSFFDNYIKNVVFNFMQSMDKLKEKDDEKEKNMEIVPADYFEKK